MENRKIKFNLGGGKSVEVNAGSLAALGLEELSRNQDVDLDKPMSWSLGLLGDLLWRLVPESRSLLAEQIERELEAAIDSNRELISVSTRTIASECFWHPFFQPALDGYPGKNSELIRYFCVLHICWTNLEYPGDMGNSKDALNKYVFEWIATTKKYLDIVQSVGGDLFDILYPDGLGFYAGE